MDSVISSLQARYGSTKTWAFLRKRNIVTVAGLASVDPNMTGIPNKQVLRNIKVYTNIILYGDHELVSTVADSLGIIGTILSCN
jgi:hypothetical protein